MSVKSDGCRRESVAWAGFVHLVVGDADELGASAAVAFSRMSSGATDEGGTYRFRMNRLPSLVTS